MSLPNILPNLTLAIRWRKASATWVIYLSGKVLESGFSSQDDALSYLDRYYKIPASRMKDLKRLSFSLGVRLTPITIPLNYIEVC